MQLTVSVTETTTMTVSLPSFREYALRELCRHSQTIMTVAFIAASLVVLASSPDINRSLESTSSFYPYIETYVDHSKTEERFFAPILEDTDRRTSSLHLRSRLGSHSTVQRHITWNATKEIVRPNNINTALALVAMDVATEGFIAERAIRSIRARGEFTGYIMLFTDQQGNYKYKETLQWDSKTIVIEGLPEDLVPRKEDGSRVKYRRHTMVYKRFKTLPFKYLDADSRFDHIRYVLYLDVDSIVAGKLSDFFDDYYTKMKDDYDAAKRILGANGREFSFWSFWKDPGAKFQLWQGGQIMQDRQHSKGCQDAWRDQMDTVWRGMDQPLLMNVVNDFPKYKCVVFELPGDGKHFDLLHTDIMEGDPKDYPTIVHITSVRVTSYEREPQQRFIRKALLLDGEAYQAGGSQSMMTKNVSWHDVTTPIGAGGIKHTE
jgi:hypothetical protein